MSRVFPKKLFNAIRGLILSIGVFSGLFGHYDNDTNKEQAASGLPIIPNLENACAANTQKNKWGLPFIPSIEEASAATCYYIPYGS